MSKQKVLEGKLKFFNQEKGYGFVTVRDQDYFLHKGVVKKGGFLVHTLEPGMVIKFTASPDKNNERIDELHQVGDRTRKQKSAQVSRRDSHSVLPLGATGVGEVKFLGENGQYGFIRIEGYADMFFHLSGVSEEVKKELRVGVEFEFEVRQSTKDDRLVAVLTSIAQNNSVSLAA